jgi:uncharacterized protein YfaS (alpha-2-macroglobulin family)
MSTPANPKQSFAKLFSMVFGTLSWHAPYWLKTLVRVARRRPIASLITLIALTATIVGGYQAYRVHQQNTQGLQFIATVTPPGLADFDRESNLVTPMELVISFVPATKNIDSEVNRNEHKIAGPASVARLDLIDKKLSASPTLSPKIPGEWLWKNERELAFKPASDWPAAQNYKVTFPAQIFAPGTKLKKNLVSFKTPPLEVALDELSFYQDPLDKKVHKITATLAFSHPVDSNAVKSAVSLALFDKKINDSKINDSTNSTNSTNIEFSLTHDQHQRVFYLQSNPLEIPQNEAYVTLSASEGINAVYGNANTSTVIADSLLIPSMATYFRVASASAQILNNPTGEPEQVLTVEFTDEVNTQLAAQQIKAFLLPSKFNQENVSWTSPQQISAEVLKQAKPVSLDAIETEGDLAKSHSYIIDIPANRQLYLAVASGLISVNNFEMVKDYDQLLTIPAYPKELQIMSKGALLSLSGEHKIPLVARGINAIKLQTHKVLPHQINHLISQTYGDISNPNFFSYQFDKNNIGIYSDEIISLNTSHPQKAIYATYDLSAKLSKDSLGLFFIHAQGWDNSSNRLIYEVADERLIMITDLGLLLKTNADNSQDIFVQSIATGRAVADATVQLLGKNGLPIMTLTTSTSGHAHFQSAETFTDDKTPVVYLAKTADDMAFIPYSRSSRELNYSRFDIGGLNTRYQNKANLNAFLFSDRGIYRPGDAVNIAAIVKRLDFKPFHKIPLEIAIEDARGNQVYSQHLTLPEFGFFDFQLQTNLQSNTGDYHAYVYIVDNKRRSSQLGHTTFKVEEFQPDTLKIHSSFSPVKKQGWLTEPALNANIDLQNLFGAPAQNRKITAKLTLMPTRFSFPEFKDYNFADPLFDPKITRQSVIQELPNTQTNDLGQANFNIDLKQYSAGTYTLGLDIQGFEAGDGRSVRSYINLLVSPLKALIGFKSQGDLNYLTRESKQTIEFINIDENLNRTARENLQLSLFQQQAVSTLVKQANGTYQYQSTIKRKKIYEERMLIPTHGASFDLPTENAGDFVLELVDDGVVVSRANFTVVGASNLAGQLEKNAELKINLSKTDYSPGETIEMHITAPYTGSGLITIEGDRVYKHQWFTSDTLSSQQTIVLPDAIEGNAYINVAFIRGSDSDEIYTSPLSYAVAPFSIDRRKRSLEIQLDSPAKIQPGEPLKINYSTSHPGRIAIFAVDEGILQVARYQSPDPLDFFLQKRALEVTTAQIVDLILPEFAQFQKSLSASGGDAGLTPKSRATNLNPFARHTDKPAAFWGGIVNASTQPQTLRFDIPDTFDGTLRIMAVAVNENAFGSASRETLVRGPFVLSPNVLTTVSPGDEFDVILGVANGVPGSDSKTAIAVSLKASSQLKVMGEAQKTLFLAEGAEGRAQFKVRAMENVGPASLTFTATLSTSSSAKTSDKLPHSERTATLSIRPAVVHANTLTSGYLKSGSGELAVNRELFEQLAESQLTASPSPMALTEGLLNYLEVYPHLCTEQLVSRIFPLLSRFQAPEQLLTSHQQHNQYRTLIDTLQSRQLTDGSFSAWPGSNQTAVFASLYVIHFLKEANDIGLNVPRRMLDRGQDYLRQLSSENHNSLTQARARAYAIYLLTRGGEVTSNYLIHLHETLDAQQTQDWQQDITAVFMASAYQLLQLNDLAAQLVGHYRLGQKRVGQSISNDRDIYDSQLGHDAVYIFLLSRHFSNRLKAINGDDILKFLTPLFEGYFNTLSSSLSILALSAFSEVMLSDENDESIKFTFNSDKIEKVMTKRPEHRFPNVEIPVAVSSIKINSNQPLFYLLQQSGYDKNPATQEIHEGMEITREYRNSAGEAVTQASLGDELEVVVRARSQAGKLLQSVAIIDLLPGGFDVIRDSVARNSTYKNWQLLYTDIREDRLVFYGDLGPQMTEINYRVKVTAAGTFTVPAIAAEAMYNLKVRAQNLPGKFTVNAPTLAVNNGNQ